MAEKKGKIDLKGLKNLFGTKKSSINMDDRNGNEDNNFDSENSHLDEVIQILNRKIKRKKQDNLLNIFDKKHSSHILNFCTTHFLNLSEIFSKISLKKINNKPSNEY